MKLRCLFPSFQVRKIDGSGGLGDVAAGLCKELGRRDDIEIAAVMPGFESVSGDAKQVAKRFDDVVFDGLKIPFGHGNLYGQVCRTTIPTSNASEPEVPCYLIRSPIFDETDPVTGKVDKNSPDKAIAFCRAVLEWIRHLDEPPDIIHSNDWHTALIPVYLQTQYRRDLRIGRTATLHTIHNATGWAFQGSFADVSGLLHLGRFDGAQVFQTGQTQSLEHNGVFNFTKGAMGYADLLVAVSQTYAEELHTSAYGGGLEGVLDSRPGTVSGVVNGIDTSEWNPAEDRLIKPHNFSATDDPKTVREKKGKIRGRLKNWTAPDGSKPFRRLKKGSMLLAMVSRISFQKFPILDACLDDLVEKKDVQLAVLGNADPKDVDGQRWVKRLTELSRKYPVRVTFFNGYDEDLSHLIYAAADAFFVPSVFEPCGLTQLVSMRYGTLPIVRFTGGIADTVVDERAGHHATGFGFAPQIDMPTSEDEFAREGALLLETIHRAQTTFHHREERWDDMVSNGLELDLSWRVPARTYRKLYEEAVLRRMRSFLHQPAPSPKTERVAEKSR